MFKIEEKYEVLKAEQLFSAFNGIKIGNSLILKDDESDTELLFESYGKENT